ncbi:MAG: EpsI family protein [Thermodesulfobacteria bacterium]|nr:EpsI family protein [Thermodesulfobacteriota bacterium]
MIKRALLLAVILLAFSWVLKTVSTQRPVPIKKDLHLFPKEIDGYRLTRVEKMDEKVENVLGVDNYLMSDYCRDDFCISLYVGYFEEQQEGAMIHSPKHCMPGGGWTPLSSEVITIETPLGPKKINRYLLQKGDRKLLVYYWYQGRGKVVASEFEDRLYLLLDRLLKRRSDGALVRLIVPYSPEAEERLRSFTKALFPVLENYLPS